MAVALTPVAFFTVTVISISLMLGLSFVMFVLAMSVFIYRCAGLACENSRFSSLFAGDVARGRTYATQRQKFHTDDVYIIYLVVMGFQMQVRSILSFS